MVLVFLLKLFCRNLFKMAASRHFVIFLLLYSRVGEYKGNVTSYWTNHNVGFLMFTCVKNTED